MISSAQMGQCNGCGSVRNDVIFNSNLGFHAGSWGTSREKIYQELGLESPKFRRSYKCLSSMFKITKSLIFT